MTSTESEIMEKSPYLFPGDSYDTPEDVPRSKVFRLLLGSRWYFYFYNFGIFIRTGSCARRGELTAARQIAFSNENVRLVERCGGKLHLRGLENLRALNGKPVVLIGNHMSLLETALLHALIREYVDFTFVIKQSLMEVPYFREIMRALDAIPVGRTNPREDLRTVLQEGKARLEKGRSVVIFPQSTRSEEFEPEAFNSIGVKLAKSAKVPVLPFALKTDFLANGRWLRDMGKLRPEREIWFDFAPAREVEGNGQTQQQQIIEFIQGRLADWRARERC